VDTSSKWRWPLRNFAFLSLGLLAGLLVFYAVVVLAALGSESLQDAVGRWVYDAVVLGAALIVLTRAVLFEGERKAWLALGAGLLLWALGQTYYSVVLYYASPAPFPSPADILFLAFYPASYLALVLLLKSRASHLDPLSWVDGLIGSLAVAGVAAALIFPPVLEALEGEPFGVAVSLAYPCFDLVLLGLLSGAFAASKWKTQGTWLLIAAALLLFAASDVVYLSVLGQSTTALNIASIGWPLAFLLLALASWLPATDADAAVAWTERRRIAVPLAMGVIGIGLLGLGSFVSIGVVAVACGVTCLLAVLVRLAITFNQNTRILAITETKAVTDSLTELANRRQLMADLEAAVSASPPEAMVLALFDLDGFKAYNDGYGHPAGDDLLRRLGTALAASVEPHGRAYRLGGDEFCILLDRHATEDDSIVEAALDALAEPATPYAVDASYGLVSLPGDAQTAVDALRLADHRMYALKHGRRATQGQAREVLLAVLGEREPDLQRHMHDVAALARAVGRRMGLDAEDLDVVVRAAELHDVGKVAIPDAILNKPGSLDETEWEFVRKHTLIGERIVSAAEALRPVGRVVRASHERWDGGGYPDGLAGEQIPLGARIVLACDAWDAMTSDRTYRRALSPEQAAAELRAHMGTQFDPDVVAALLTIVLDGALSGALR
jgi:two-component system cell cycle response regulator